MTKEDIISRIKNIDKEVAKISFDRLEPVFDGIINIDRYYDSKYKILWILKEPNSKNAGGWDMRDFIANDLHSYKNWKKTYKMIILSTVGLLNNFKRWDNNLRYSENENMDILKSIAYINLKKEPGNSTSKDRVIKKSFNQNKNLIFKQIELCNPDIIIFGGTYKYFTSEDIKTISQDEKIILVSSSHPNARIKHEDIYNNIISTVKEQLLILNK